MKFIERTKYQDALEASGTFNGELVRDLHLTEPAFTDWYNVLKYPTMTYLWN